MNPENFKNDERNQEDVFAGIAAKRLDNLDQALNMNDLQLANLEKLLGLQRRFAVDDPEYSVIQAMNNNLASLEICSDEEAETIIAELVRLVDEF